MSSGTAKRCLTPTEYIVPALTFQYWYLFSDMSFMTAFCPHPWHGTKYGPHFATPNEWRNSRKARGLGISSHSTHTNPQKPSGENNRSYLNTNRWMISVVNSKYLSYLMTPFQRWVSGIVIFVCSWHNVDFLVDADMSDIHTAPIFRVERLQYDQVTLFELPHLDYKTKWLIPLKL